MKREDFLELLSKKLSHGLSATEHAAFQSAIAQHKDYQQLANELHLYLDSKKEKGAVPDEKLRATWAAIAKAQQADVLPNNTPTRPMPATFSKNMLWFKIAAVLVVVLSVAIFSGQLFNRNATQTGVVLASNQHKLFKVLDDGTKIWLNKGSSIRYNQAFGKEKRELFLEGEAYFDVAKNQAVPLFIHARNVDIEVKGTAFNVNAYPQNPTVEVALVRGAVQVTDKLHGNRQVVLKPNEKLSVPALALADYAFSLTRVSPNLLANETRWIIDSLVFKKEKLSDLALRMEKKYDLKISIQSAELKEKRFSGVFVNETINEALDALKLSYPFVYTIANKQVVINQQ